MIFDPDALIEQLEAVQELDCESKRLVGEVLLDYGREMIASSDRLDELQRFTLQLRERRARESA